jgi:hypothetical protein
MATEPISAAYLINPSLQSVCLYVSLSCRCKVTARLSVPLHLMLGNGSVNTYLRQQIHAAVIFYAVRVL